MGTCVHKDGKARRRMIRPAAIGFACALAPLVAFANPQGGTIDGSGSGEINQIDAQTLEINQFSDKLIIDWASFDIAEGEVTRFVQPGTNSIALNRVVGGGGPSAIMGRLEANGSVFVINEAGIVFGPNAVVDVHSFVASTANIGNASFLADDFTFDQASAIAGAEIVNNGSITVADTGLAALVGQRVINNNIIAARLGKVILGGAETFTIDLYGDGLLSFAGPAGTDAPFVENTGTLSADGGVVLMTAQTASDIVDTVVNMSGVVEARTVSVDGGDVVLTGTVMIAGGEGGVTDVSGTVDVSGADAGETGGAVTVSGETVDVNAATIAASGAAGGGSLTVEANEIQVVTFVPPGSSATTFVSTALVSTALLDGVAVTLHADTTLSLGLSSDIVATAGAGGGALTLRAQDTVSLLTNSDITLANTALTIESLAGDVSMAPSADIVVDNGAVQLAALNDVTIGQLTVRQSGSGAAGLDVDAGNAIDRSSTSGPTISVEGETPVALTAPEIGLDSDVSIATTGTAPSLAAETLAGSGGGIDLTLTDADFASLSVTLADTAHTVDLDLAGANALEVTPSATTSTVSADLTESGADLTFALTDTDGDLAIETGTIASTGDVTLSSARDLIIGTGAGEAVALTGTDLLLSLAAGRNIVNGGGTLDLGTNGALSFDAGGSVGTAVAPVDVFNAGAVAAQAADGLYLTRADGGLLTIGTAGTLTGLSATAGDIALTVDDLAVNAAVSAHGDVIITTLTDGTAIVLNGLTSSLGLDLAELLQIDGSTLAFDAQGGALTIGEAGDLDLSASAFDLMLSAGDITFFDTGTLILADGRTLDIAAASITGGGDRADITIANGALRLTVPGTSVLSTEVAFLSGTTGPLTLTNAGALTLDQVLTTSGATDLTADGDLVMAGTGGIDASGHNERVTLASTSGAIDADQGTMAFASNQVVLTASTDLALSATSSAGQTVALSAISETGAITLRLAGGRLQIADLGPDATGFAADQGTVRIETDDLDVAAPVTASESIEIAGLTDGTDFSLPDEGDGLALSADELNRLETDGAVRFVPGAGGSLILVNDQTVDLTTRTWQQLTLEGASIQAGASLLTAGTQILFDAPVVLTRSVTVDTAVDADGAPITFAETLGTAADGPYGLTARAGTGAVLFSLAAGTEALPLASLDASGGTVTATDIFSVGPIALSGSNGVLLANPAAAPLVTLETDGAPITIAGLLDLDGDTLFDTGGAAGLGADITLDDVALDGFAFTLDAGTTGAVAMGSVSDGSDPQTGSLTLERAGSAAIAGSIVTDALSLLDIAGEAVVSGVLTLRELIIGASDAAVRLLGGGSVETQVEALNTGGLTLGDGDSFTFAQGIIATAGTTATHGTIGAGGSGILFGPVVLDGDTVLTTLNGSDVILGAVTGNGQALTIDAGGTGLITLASLLNQSAGAPTGSLSVANTGGFEVTGRIETATLTLDTGAYAVSLLDGGEISDPVDFVNSGGVTLGNAADDSFVFAGGFTSITLGATTLAGQFATQSAPILLERTVLGTDTVINTQGGGLGGDVTVRGLIDGLTPGGSSFDVTAGPGGTILFETAVGSQAPLRRVDLSAGMITVSSITTTDGQSFMARLPDGTPGLVTLNSDFVTGGGDLVISANLTVTGDLDIDTALGSSGGVITIGEDGTVITVDGPGGATIDLLGGGAVRVLGVFSEEGDPLNALNIQSAGDVELAGGTFGNVLTVNAGAVGGDLLAVPGQSILVTGPVEVTGATTLTATGDIAFLEDLSTFSLLMQLNGAATSQNRSRISVIDDFVIGGLTDGEGESDLRGDVRGVRSDLAASFARQLGERRSDRFLLNGCVIGVGCSQFDRSTIVLRAFDIQVDPFRQDEEAVQIRFSDLGNFEIFRQLGLTNDWADDEEEDEE